MHVAGRHGDAGPGHSIRRARHMYSSIHPNWIIGLSILLNCRLSVVVQLALMVSTRAIEVVGMGGSILLTHFRLGTASSRRRYKGQGQLR